MHARPDVLDQPLQFERICLEKIWGGRSLADTPGIELPPGERIGETWEVVDRGDQNSVVRGGPFEGRSLRQLMEAHAHDILGEAEPAAGGRFPLLVKYIDASQNLSVQVHPDDAAAARIGGGAQGKTEAWYLLGGGAEARLFAGLRPGVDAEAFGRAASTSGVVDMLESWSVRPGQAVLVPGGTVHAIGEGITLLEVQQNSDTTYRLYDWGRVGSDGQPRETHVERALQCAAFGEPARGPVDPAWTEAGDGLLEAPLVDSPYFAMAGLRVRGRARLATGRQFRIYAAVGGAGSLTVEGRSELWRLEPGDVVLVPAATGAHAVEPDGEELVLVRLSARP